MRYSKVGFLNTPRGVAAMYLGLAGAIGLGCLVVALVMRAAH